MINGTDMVTYMRGRLVETPSMRVFGQDHEITHQRRMRFQCPAATMSERLMWYQGAENSLALLLCPPSLEGTALHGDLGVQRNWKKHKVKGERNHQAVRGEPETKSRSRSGLLHGTRCSLVSKWRIVHSVLRPEIAEKVTRKAMGHPAFPSKAQGDHQLHWGTVKW